MQELMLTRRQKTLSNISNFMPLHIVLNEPAGVKFSITVPRFFTVEQLARQIEAEYAYLVEREIGHSRFPVIECGALFDHLEPDSKNRRGSRQRARNNKSTTCLSQPQSPQSQSQPQDQGPSHAPSDKSPADVDDSNDSIESNESNDSIDSNDNDNDDDTDSNIEDEHNSGDSDSDQDTFPDERDEQESRGVQLRFSDIVSDVLDRDSTVHVVNIDQGMYTMSETPSYG
ncbi:hypothetical protein BG005_000747 [Podila minutissima]|nr:hypothetical protein BG005_000747 [Podila minutissima]